MYWNDNTVITEDGQIRLTLTWDVLKFTLNTAKTTPDFGLTLTWDVLKSVWLSIVDEPLRININMRCIEI